jgi:hypothetical protein
MVDKQPEESPVVEETPNTEAQELSAEQQAHELLSQLEKLNVQTPEDLSNMAQASSQSGRLANILGEVKQELAAVRQENAQLRAQPPQEGYNEYDTRVEF